jgi:murein DD-endopeptidase MepM/ murein hydrolase activator NlpD
VLVGTVALALATVLMANGLSLSHAAPPPIKPRPYGYPGALDVFPVDPPCFYSNSWGASRSGGRKHEGVDIILARGKPIYAVRDGRVSKKYSGGALAGNGIAIQTSDGTYFFYAHLDRFAEGIRKGSRVKAGDIIGYVGSTGATLVPHLHFEVHPKGGKAVDPTPYVAQVDRCGYKGPKLKKIEPPTTTTEPTTTVKKTTTTVKKTTTTVKPATTTTVKKTTTTVKPTTTTVKPTTTTVKKTTTTVKADPPTSTTDKGSDSTGPPDPEPKIKPLDADAPSIPLMNGMVRAKVRARVQVAGTGPLPPGLTRADVKFVVSGTKTPTGINVSDCKAPLKRVMLVQPGKRMTRTFVLPLSKDGKICFSTTGKAKVQVTVRRAWTSSDTKITVVDAVKAFESTSTKSTPTTKKIIRVKVSLIDGLPSKVGYMLLAITATGGEKNSTVLVGRCGSKRSEFMKVTAKETSTVEGWVALKGRDLCISASRATPVVVNVLGFG